jgi:hypothetical protein
MNFIDEVDLYDLVKSEFVVRNAKGKMSVKLESLKAMVLVEVPVRGIIARDGNKLMVNGVVVDFHAPVVR